MQNRNSTLPYKLAIGGGAVAIAAGVILAINKSGGWYTTNALVTVALGLALFVGALIAGKAWRTSAAAAGVIVIGMCATEAYNLFVTVEASMITRAERFAPLHKQAQKREQLEQRLSELEKSEPVTPRLDLAKKELSAATSNAETLAVKLARKADAEAKAAVEAEAQQVRCGKQCQRKQALADKAAQDLKDALAAAAAQRETRIDDAKAEVQAALADAEAVHAADIEKAKADLEATPEPDVSPTIFSDKTGVEPWKADIAQGLLRSLAINMLGAGLIAFGAAGLFPASRVDPDIADLHRTFSGPLPDPDNDARTVAEIVRPNFRDGGQSVKRRRGPNRPRPSGGVATKSDAFEDLMQRLADGRTIPSDETLAGDWNRPKQTVSDWMRSWRKAGVIPAAVKSGRRNVTVA